MSPELKTCSFCKMLIDVSVIHCPSCGKMQLVEAGGYKFRNDDNFAVKVLINCAFCCIAGTLMTIVFVFYYGLIPGRLKFILCGIDTLENMKIRAVLGFIVGIAMGFWFLRKYVTKKPFDAKQ